MNWDLVSGVISKVTTVIITYKPIKVLITLLTKSHDPPSTLDDYTNIIFFICRSADHC